MAHHLPRKKYLSKLHDKSCRVSTPSNTDSSMSGESLAPNESRESLLTAIANSTQFGMSSEFGSGVFRVDGVVSRSAVSDLSLSADADEQTHGCEVVSGCDANTQMIDTAAAAPDDDDDDDKADESHSSPVYFDDGSTDDDSDDEGNTVRSRDEVTCSSDVAVPWQQTSRSVTITDSVPRSTPALTPSSSGCPPLPASASLSSLIDTDLLNNLLPSAESFSNLLNSLESKDRAPFELQRQQLQSKVALSCVASGQTDGSSDGREHSSTHTSATDRQLSASVEPLLCVKEEQVDSSYDQQQQLMMTTTSGRNRGRGKALEPKYECQICGDVAAGYHCGAYVCEACKVLHVLLLLIYLLLTTYLLTYYLCSTDPVLTDHSMSACEPTR